MEKQSKQSIPYWPRLMKGRMAANYIGVSFTTLRSLNLPTVPVRSLRMYDRHTLDAYIDNLSSPAHQSKEDLLKRL